MLLLLYVYFIVIDGYYCGYEFSTSVRGFEHGEFFAATMCASPSTMVNFDVQISSIRGDQQNTSVNGRYTIRDRGLYHIVVTEGKAIIWHMMSRNDLLMYLIPSNKLGTEYIVPSVLHSAVIVAIRNETNIKIHESEVITVTSSIRVTEYFDDKIKSIRIVSDKPVAICESYGMLFPVGYYGNIYSVPFLPLETNDYETWMVTIRDDTNVTINSQTFEHIGTHILDNLKPLSHIKANQPIMLFIYLPSDSYWCALVSTQQFSKTYNFYFADVHLNTWISLILDDGDDERLRADNDIIGSKGYINKSDNSISIFTHISTMKSNVILSGPQSHFGGVIAIQDEYGQWKIFALSQDIHHGKVRL